MRLEASSLATNSSWSELLQVYPFETQIIQFSNRGPLIKATAPISLQQMETCLKPPPATRTVKREKVQQTMVTPNKREAQKETGPKTTTKRQRQKQPQSFLRTNFPLVMFFISSRARR